MVNFTIYNTETAPKKSKELLGAVAVSHRQP